MLIAQHGSIPWENQTTTKWEVKSSWCLAFGKSQQLVLTGLAAYFSCEFAFLACKPHQLRHPRMYRVWWPGTSCQAEAPISSEGVWEWVHDHGVYWSYQVPHHSGAPGPIEHGVGLLMSPLKLHFSGKIFIWIGSQASSWVQRGWSHLTSLIAGESHVLTILGSAYLKVLVPKGRYTSVNISSKTPFEV